MMRSLILLLVLLFAAPAWAVVILPMMGGAELLLPQHFGAGLVSPVARFFGMPQGPGFVPDFSNADYPSGIAFTQASGSYDLGSFFFINDTFYEYCNFGPRDCPHKMSPPSTVFTTPGVPLIVGDYTVPVHMDVQLSIFDCVFANCSFVESYELVSDFTWNVTLTHPFPPPFPQTFWHARNGPGATETPEPATWLLLLTGLAILTWSRLRSRPPTTRPPVQESPPTPTRTALP